MSDDFKRDDHGKKDRVSASWRKPRGHHNKIRLNERGHAAPVSTGYGSPVATKGLHPSGLEPVTVHNLDELEELGEGQGAVIASAVGDRKRVAMLESALDHDIDVLNLDARSYVEQVRDEMEARREETDDETEEADTDEEPTGATDEEDLEEQKEKVLTKK